MKKKREEDAEDELLEKCISGQAIDRPIFLYICCALITITPPTYVYLSVFTFEFFNEFSYSPFMVVIFPLISIYFLTRSYDVMFSTELNKRSKHFMEAGKTNVSLQSLRSTVALSWTIFFINAVYLLLVFFLQLYLFNQLDTYFNFMLTFSISSISVYILALKNDESFQRRRKKL
ncbi:hypothetical protein XU18_4974 [Perkinsela sp. CCAP 1560/4]|nr:hypothetical protein XU18_4974 [Perkinsela sp. CCAP 1560/4]|eukprot:KNH03704.1 hypothetical protein XU18_4974 [Perkinsela sp. CCAP 1560/4]